MRSVRHWCSKPAFQLDPEPLAVVDLLIEETKADGGRAA
jgi:hypothetical protein